jgi:lipopolysaccharide/colanic/teichoic acid biosynthesis glycosyltransferase
MSQEQFAKFQKSTQSDATAPYRRHLGEKRADLAFKRAFDIFSALLCIIVLSPIFLAAALAVGLGSKGPVFYRQLRVGRGGGPLYVLKFRTMRVGADKSGEITVGSGDERITGVGRLLRATNLDELPQFFQVLCGQMSIVGARPEVPHYVEYYSDEDFATLLMSPGLTSPVAIRYRHENDMLTGAEDPEKLYVERILPDKMALNREYVREFSFRGDMRILGATFRCLFEKDDAVDSYREKQ